MKPVTLGELFRWLIWEVNMLHLLVGVLAVVMFVWLMQTEQGRLWTMLLFAGTLVSIALVALLLSG